MTPIKAALVVALVAAALVVVAALAQPTKIDTDLEFVVLVTAVDHKPIYINPRAVTYIAPHDERITRVGFIGGDVRSVEGRLETIAAALMQVQQAKGGAP